MQSFTAGKNEDGMRLDKLIDRILPQAGKGFAYKMLRKKNIVLNGKKAEGNERLSVGDEIKFFLSDETYTAMGGVISHAAPGAGGSDAAPVETADRTGSAAASVKAADRTGCAGRIPARHGIINGGFDFAANIIYADSDVILVNKPEGILSQKAGQDDISLNEYLLEYAVQQYGLDLNAPATFRPSVCNRLDRNTSGIVCCGVSLKGLRALSRMFRDRTVHKYYLALCKGEILVSEHKKAYLVKDEATNKVTVSDKPAEGAELIETAWRPLKYRNGCTLAEVELFTGKSHQIRAQLAHEGHPIAGDNKYGDAAFNRAMRDRYKVRSQMLAAYRIVFPKTEVLPGISGREFKDEKALAHALWGEYLT
ncbi:MAG: RluA family pseudouridine synthase [Lachnospiraceae bacterium]|nr:RluA family pseudouridine synthase [Lachnospiraceae bacterium]